jgi:hypothetical protein
MKNNIEIYRPMNLYTNKYSISYIDFKKPNIERYIRFRTFVKIMPNSKREMYVCFSKEEISLLEEYAKNKGALNISQALESLVKEKK